MLKWFNTSEVMLSNVNISRKNHFVRKLGCCRYEITCLRFWQIFRFGMIHVCSYCAWCGCVTNMISAILKFAGISAFLAPFGK